MIKFLLLIALLGAGVLASAQPRSLELLVLNKEENSLMTIDVATGKIIGRVATGEGPHEVTASSDGKLAFVANYGARQPGGTLSVIDLTQQKELRRVDLGALRRPHGICFAGGKVYFTAEVNKAIARYDPAGDRIDWILGTGQNRTHMLVLSKDETKIFTANIESDSVTAIERASATSDWTETIIPVGKGPEGIDMLPNGKEVWTAQSRDGGISIIDVAAKKVAQTFDIHTKRSNRLKFTPDGKHVLVSDLDAGELIVLDAPTRREIKRIKLGRMTEGILIPPDGSRAYVAVAGENKVAVIDLNSFEVINSFSTGAGPDGMAWVERR